MIDMERFKREVRAELERVSTLTREQLREECDRPLLEPSGRLLAGIFGPRRAPRGIWSDE